MLSYHSLSAVKHIEKWLTKGTKSSLIKTYARWVTTVLNNKFSMPVDVAKMSYHKTLKWAGAESTGVVTSTMFSINSPVSIKFNFWSVL